MIIIAGSHNSNGSCIIENESNGCLKGALSLNKTILGAGHGVPVLEMSRAFEKSNRCRVPFLFQGRRQGDIASRTPDDMCADAWRWQKTVGAANTPESTN
jgi:UDP-glucose 4-epimerase